MCAALCIFVALSQPNNFYGHQHWAPIMLDVNKFYGLSSLRYQLIMANRQAIFTYMLWKQLWLYVGSTVLTQCRLPSLSVPVSAEFMHSTHPFGVAAHFQPDMIFPIPIRTPRPSLLALPAGHHKFHLSVHCFGVWESTHQRCSQCSFALTLALTMSKLQ